MELRGGQSDKDRRGACQVIRRHGADAHRAPLQLVKNPPAPQMRVNRMPRRLGELPMALPSNESSDIHLISNRNLSLLLES